MNRRDSEPGKGHGMKAMTMSSLAVWPILVAWLFDVGWLLSPLASRLGGRWQALVWIPDWVWLALVGFCSTLALCILAMSRRATSWSLVLAAALAVVGPLWGTLHRDLRFPARSAQGDATVLFLNSQDPGSRVVGSVVEQLVAMDSEIAVIVNPGWIPLTWRAVETSGADRPVLSEIRKLLCRVANGHQIHETDRCQGRDSSNGSYFREHGQFIVSKKNSRRRPSL